MKKILFIAALLISGAISSCTKENVAPTTLSTMDDNSKVATVDGQTAVGDGGIDRPKRPHADH